jgi:hypothetical protein
VERGAAGIHCLPRVKVLSELCRLRHKLRINRDLHFVANDDTAGFEQLVPAQTKVLAIELSGCTEAGSVIPGRILGEALERRIESDFLRHTVKREIADESVLGRVARHLLDTSTSEYHRWIGVDFEEVG